MFLDDAEPEGDEELTLVDLDPNGDRDRSDAAATHQIAVGDNAVDGRFGHHDLATEPTRDRPFVVNPGDGTLVAVNLENWKPGDGAVCPREFERRAERRPPDGLKRGPTNVAAHSAAAGWPGASSLSDLIGVSRSFLNSTSEPSACTAI
ncbi:hypothetical protein [Alienimonas californiensis]|uniref:Uncharacterized protein n=1 Tax=Alienimonas californiensis TaxID=2527989 RepID=A0A517P6P2_9PLAN|nr:hypothetical protein [Alienimonas californiensis]QDT15033.1 hypothetical protein CA12_11130 [Alienimonas californiensis]